MGDRQISERELSYLEFFHREQHFHHMGRDAEQALFLRLREGDAQAIEQGDSFFRAALQGSLSGDPVRNYRYLFVASITLCCRSCIDGGLSEERAFNISDLYIRKMDTLETEQEIIALHRDMLEFYHREMTTVTRRRDYARPVRMCLSYIDTYLHEPISMEALASHVGLNESYLSTLFKKETGIPVSQYIRQRRIEEAEEMLRYTDYSCSDIANFLAFCSQSHFISVFRQATGLTPGQYRSRYAASPLKLQESQRR